MHAIDIGAIAVSLGLFLVYHLFLYLGVYFSYLHNAQLSMNLKSIVSWVTKHIEKGDAPTVTLAIQTFRNTILVATFIGGNAFTNAFDLTSDYKNIDSDEFLKVRSIVMSTLLFCSFLCWACTIRYVSHLGYNLGSLSYEQAALSAKASSSREVSTMVDPLVDNTEKDDAKEVAHKRRTLEEDCVRKAKLVLIFFRYRLAFLLFIKVKTANLDLCVVGIGFVL
eukprot:scaffold1769_cov164-Ochromonas_danica.AAC.20